MLAWPLACVFVLPSLASLGALGRVVGLFACLGVGRVAVLVRCGCGCFGRCVALVAWLVACCLVLLLLVCWGFAVVVAWLLFLACFACLVAFVIMRLR